MAIWLLVHKWSRISIYNWKICPQQSLALKLQQMFLTTLLCSFLSQIFTNHYSALKATHIIIPYTKNNKYLELPFKAWDLHGSFKSSTFAYALSLSTVVLNSKD